MDYFKAIGGCDTAQERLTTPFDLLDPVICTAHHTF
jgi:hypothetical protein